MRVIVEEIDVDERTWQSCEYDGRRFPDGVAPASVLAARPLPPLSVCSDQQSFYMDFDYTFPALVAARVVLAFAPLPDALKHSQQLSSPLTSYERRMFSSVA